MRVQDFQEYLLKQDGTVFLMGNLNLNEFFNQFKDFELVNSSLTYIRLSHQINNFNKFSLNISKALRAQTLMI